MPLDMQAVKEYDILWIRAKKEAENVEFFNLSLECPGTYYLKTGEILEITIKNREEITRIEENKYTKYLDYDRINNCLSFRFRQAGDYIAINDMGQKKSLKEYFIHEKIPAELRSKIPLIADGKHILWIIHICAG